MAGLSDHPPVSALPAVQWALWLLHVAPLPPLHPGAETPPHLSTLPLLFSPSTIGAPLQGRQGSRPLKPPPRKAARPAYPPLHHPCSWVPISTGGGAALALLHSRREPGHCLDPPVLQGVAHWPPPPTRLCASKLGSCPAGLLRMQLPDGRAWSPLASCSVLACGTVAWPPAEACIALCTHEHMLHSTLATPFCPREPNPACFRLLC